MTENKRILIVGGVAGGASAAARARRLDENAEIIMFERGKYISFANCGLPYHIGGEIENRDSLLVQTPQAMRKRYNIDIRTETEVTSIDPQKKEIEVKDLKTGSKSTENYDFLILSPGAEPVKPPLPGADNEKVFTLRSIPDMDAIKDAVDHQNAKRAVVIGGGYIGLEMTEALISRGLEVSLVELQDQVFAPMDAEMADPIHRELKLNGVELLLGTSVQSIEKTQTGMNVTLSKGGEKETDIVIMAIGVRPETKLAEAAGLTLGKTGGIQVDKHMQTSDPYIYAVGDAVEVQDFVSGSAALIPLAGPANRQARIALNNIYGREDEYKHTQGTSVCKIFDLTAATTGLSEKLLNRNHISYEKIYIHPASHATYYPGAAQLSMKLLFNPDNGKILGAQITGTDGVDKRIDCFAIAIRAGLTVQDLEDLELSYAPPYGSAKDPVNFAGFVASNVISGDMPTCHTEDIDNRDENAILLDVRTVAEVEAGTIDGALNIPIDELRQRLEELPTDKEILVFCRVGLRGYIATRILQQKGFNCKNLTGGIVTYKAVKGIGQNTATKPKNQKSEDKTMPEKTQQDKNDLNIVSHIDARAVACPGPIMRLKAEIEKIQPNQALTITTADSGFAADVAGWCETTGNQCIDIIKDNSYYTATIVKGQANPKSQAVNSADKTDSKTIVVFSNDFDKAMASFIIANGAAAMGAKVTMFFTFWGLNLLRKENGPAVKKNLVEKMFGFMMPKGPNKTTLSKMHMAGLGTKMIKGIMKKKNVSSLPELIDSAQKSGVRLVACSMSMDLMGIKKAELLETVEEGGVAAYLNSARDSSVNLFI